MFYIYIIYSESSDKFYVGYSNDPFRRLTEHNTKPFNTYASKHRPWRLEAIFKCSQDEKEAIRIEKFIKQQKSRKLLKLLCDPQFSPTGELAKLPACRQAGLESRIPQGRDRHCGTNQELLFMLKVFRQEYSTLCERVLPVQV